MTSKLDSKVKVVHCAVRHKTYSTRLCNPILRAQDPDQHPYYCRWFTPFPQDASQEVLQDTPQTSHGFRSLEAAAAGREFARRILTPFRPKSTKLEAAEVLHTLAETRWRRPPASCSHSCDAHRHVVTAMQLNARSLAAIPGEAET